jgi:hypothetical protein
MLDENAISSVTAVSLTYVNTVVLAREMFEQVVSETAGGPEAVRERWRDLLETKRRKDDSESQGEWGKLRNGMLAVSGILGAGVNKRAALVARLQSAARAPAATQPVSGDTEPVSA